MSNFIEAMGMTAAGLPVLTFMLALVILVVGAMLFLRDFKRAFLALGVGVFSIVGVAIGVTLIVGEPHITIVDRSTNQSWQVKNAAQDLENGVAIRVEEPGGGVTLIPQDFNGSYQLEIRRQGWFSDEPRSGHITIPFNYDGDISKLFGIDQHE